MQHSAISSNRNKMVLVLFTISFIMLFFGRVAFARDNISIVGSGTVYPFASLIAEQYAKETGNPTPIVERTGTGGGFEIFCKGIGFSYPDINDASRPISPQEAQNCADNGISSPIAITIGYDGIGLFNSKKLGHLHFTKHQLFLALAAKVPDPKNSKIWIANPYQKWSDIDKSLPNIPIKIMGPPSTSGTRDTFIKLVLKDSCPKSGLSDDQVKQYCSGRLRYDGAWIDGSENYSLIIQKISQSTDTIAIMGFNYYENNKTLVNPAVIDSVALTKQNIMAEKYPLSRPLFIYVKKEHLDAVPNLRDYVQYLISPQTLGQHSYLADNGLIPLSAVAYKNVVKEVNAAIKE